MFKKRIRLDDVMAGSNFLSDMMDGDVYQVTIGGQEPKIILTQEHYFSLMARIEKFAGTIKTTKYDSEKLMSDFENSCNSGKKN